MHEAERRGSESGGCGNLLPVRPPCNRSSPSVQCRNNPRQPLSQMKLSGLGRAPEMWLLRMPAALEGLPR